MQLYFLKIIAIYIFIEYVFDISLFSTISVHFRALEGTDLLITFVPASFDDLRLLINGPECLKEPTLTTDQGTDMNVDNVTEVDCSP